MAKLDKQGLNTFIRELDKHINTKINRLDISLKAEKVLMSDGTSVEETVSANKTSILNSKINVSVKEFGAIGNGITDDTQAFKECIDYAILNNKTVYIPKGIYILSPNILQFDLMDNQSFVMVGDGASSIIKRKDQTTISDWCTLFRVISSAKATKDIEIVKLQNFKIDSNATNQQQPSSNYGFEHCADFYICGMANSRINTVKVEGVYATDGVADHIYIAGSTDAYVDNFIVNDFQCDYRNRTRSDLCVTGHIKTAMFSNIKCVVLEYEFNNAEGLGESQIFLNNIETERLDLDGAGLQVYGSNIKVSKGTHIASMKGAISSSLFTFSGGRIVRTKGLSFSNCTFVCAPNDDGSVSSVNVQYPNDLIFNNCTFSTNGELDNYTGYLFYSNPSSEGMKLKFSNCIFDGRVETSVYFNRCGECLIENSTFYNKTPIMLNASSGYKLNTTLKNINIENNTKSLHIEGGSSDYLSLYIYNMICNENNFKISNANSSCDDFLDIAVDRKIFLTKPFTKDWLKNDVNGGKRNIYLFKGDKFINKNASLNEPHELEVTKTNYGHDLNANYWNIKAIGNGFGTTEERPTCYLNAGFQYFDTDLNKNIIWNGSSWIE